MNLISGTGTQPQVVEQIDIRNYATEVRKHHWKRCYAFNVGGSEESSPQTERVYLSLFFRNAAGQKSDVSNAKLSAVENDKSCNDTGYYSDDVTLKSFLESRRRMISYKMDHENDMNIETDNDSECSSKQTAPVPASVSDGENTCGSFLSSDDEMMAADILLKMSNGGVQTKTLSKTAAEKEAVSMAKGKAPCEEEDEHVTPAAGYGLPEDIMNEMSVCVMNRNPSEFKTEEARNFRREC